MNQRIPLARSVVSDADLAAVDRALRSGRLVLGPENARFEQALAERCGRRHAICVSSGTAALELALWALDLSPGDEVLIPAFGFPAAANMVVAMKGVPVPIDLEATTWLGSLDAASDAITDRTKFFVSIDQFGLVAPGRAVAEFAAEHGLTLINDAACGLGGTDSSGERGGRRGTAAALSFHARKVVCSGEGGAILCDDDELAARFRCLRNHGQIGRGMFAEVGFNRRLAEASAALGAAQLARIDSALAERALLATGYCQRLAKLAEDGRISWQLTQGSAVHAYQTFAILLDDSIDRARVSAVLEERDIESGPATYSFHRLASLSPFLPASAELPVADALHERSLALPLYLGMRSQELDRVCDALTEAIG